MSAKPTEECVPGPSCIIAMEALSELKTDVRQIRNAIVGDEALGQVGLVRRQAKLEEEVSVLKSDAANARTSVKVLAGAAVVIGSVLSAAASVAVQYFTKK